MRRKESWRSLLQGSEPLRRFGLEDAAQDLIEYALIAAVMALMCAAALSPVAQALNNGVTKAGKKFKQHTDHGLHKGWYK